MISSFFSSVFGRQMVPARITHRITTALLDNPNLNPAQNNNPIPNPNPALNHILNHTRIANQFVP